MTATADTAFEGPQPTAESGSVWTRFDSLVERWGERLNPILVKETRQALKSKQFTITFALVLGTGWIWSMMGIAGIGPQVHYVESGAPLFVGYFEILAFALFIIVPFGAFRSIAAEQEDRTYELLSITSLTPRQIVAGKLTSAIAQMMVYMSALAPCLAFTYMLRGVSLPVIATVVFYLFVVSLGLTMLALLFGTLTSHRHWQVLLSVVVVVGLFLVFWGASIVMTEEFRHMDVPIDEYRFWAANGMMMTAFVTTFLLVFFAAVANVTFASDNRSTRLRVVMAIQQVCLIGWIAWFLFVEAPQDREFVLGVFALSAIYWGILGALISGERTELSVRVKRGLPGSFFGRVLFTWFQPGPGTGYIFVTCGMLTALICGLAMLAINLAHFPNDMWRPLPTDVITVFAVLITCYVIAYLGVGSLIMRLLRRVTEVTLFLSGLIHVLLLISGVALPILAESVRQSWRLDEYSLLQMSNPFWTLAYVVDTGALPPESTALVVFIPALTGIVFLVNLPVVLREIRHTRIAAPARVIEEDAELAAIAHPPKHESSSPWDEP